MDYEQQYYDLLYENRRLKQENDRLKSELEVYKMCEKDYKNGLIQYVISQTFKRKKIKLESDKNE